MKTGIFKAMKRTVVRSDGLKKRFMLEMRNGRRVRGRPRRRWLDKGVRLQQLKEAADHIPPG